MPCMAKIVASDEAPKGKFRFSLANEEIEKLPYKTDDAVVLANAEAHPWLTVEREAVEELAEQGDPFPQVKAEDDALGHLNSVANDPKAVRDALVERGASAPVAIDAGLDQNEVVETKSGVAETVAADKAADDKKDKE